MTSDLAPEWMTEAEARRRDSNAWARFDYFAERFVRAKRRPKRERNELWRRMIQAKVDACEARDVWIAVAKRDAEPSASVHCGSHLYGDVCGRSSGPSLGGGVAGGAEPRDSTLHRKI